MIDTTSYLNSKDIAEHWRDIGFVCTLSHIFMDTINLPCLVAMIQVLSTNWNKTSFLLIIMSKYAKINQKISKRSQSNERQGNNGA